ncbi:MAG: hypothetical protein ABSG43_21610 [Solirubrobacteraceae bacterium]
MTTVYDGGQLEMLPARTPDVQYRLVRLDDLAGYQDARPAAGLVELIARVGRVLAPVLVVAQADGRWRLVDGRRRAKAVALLEGEGRWPSPATLPALIITTPDSPSAEVRRGLTLALHASRSPSPASELAAIEAILARAAAADEQATVKRIAAQTAMPIQTVRRRLRLRALSPELRAALDRGELAVSVAERAARLTAEQQATLQQTLAAGERITLNSVRGIARRRATGAAAALPDDVFEDRGTPWQVTVRGHLHAALDAIPTSQRESPLAFTITKAACEVDGPRAVAGERVALEDADRDRRLLQELRHVACYLHQQGIGDGACAVTDAIHRLTATPHNV